MICDFHGFLLILQSSSIISTMSRDEFIQHNVHLRKLNQPFEWHSQGPGSNPDEVVEKNNVLNNETTQENTKKKPTTCRNSVQGKIWIADDHGRSFYSVYICLQELRIISFSVVNRT